MAVRNVWAIKKDTGRTISIADLPDEENGSKSNCECPYCHADFIARKLGKVRTAHFAHSGEGCDIEKANMIGLFRLIHEYLMSSREICFPTAKWNKDNLVYSPHPFIVPITGQNFDKRVTLDIDMNNPKKCTFESAEIIRSQNDYPIAILCKIKGYTLALRVIPPATICKTATRTAYEDLPTLLLDLSEKYFEELSRKEIGTILNDVSLFSWKQYVPLSPKERQQIIERSKALCEIERMKQKDTTINKHLITSSKSIPNNPSPSFPRTPFKQYGDTICLATEEMTYQRIANEPKIVLDTQTGERIGVCYVCKRAKSKNVFEKLPVYGNQKNVGICKSCAKKNRKI